ncbi:EF-TU receptor [Prunus dulcis]|uniref:EF-TU receptor n=1 Tax=Prunus dulcis TaxID=3755 RepID=A0A4Y1RT71_PRUDU|nr:EF-TU receptor [Prunus dulcis]
MQLMEVCVIAKCTYKSETIMFSVSSESSMVDILKTLCLRFRGLQLGCFTLRYSVPSYPSCFLETDSDLDLMRTFLLISNEKTVDILVKDLCGISEYSGDFCVNKELIACEKGESSCSSTVEDRNEFLGRSKRASAKPLLSNEWETYIHHVGQKFDGGAEEFRLKLCKYALEVGFNFLYAGNDKKRVVAVCSNKKLEGCSWRVYASRCEATGSFVIRTLNNVHTCAGRIRESKSKMMRSRVVSSLIVDRIRAKPELKPVEIIHEFKDYYGIDISYYHAWFGKELAKLDVHGDESKSFNELVWYTDAVKETNTGSLCTLDCEAGINRFRRASTRGFSVLRERMEIKGFILWLLELLILRQRRIGLVSSTFGFYIATDGESGDLFLGPQSRCAYAVTEEEFKVAMEELVIVGSSKVKAFISDLSRDHYANAFFKGMRYGEMANSLAESFNNWVGVFRDLPVLPLIEGIRQKLMVLNSQRRFEAEKWTTVLCPEMETRLCENAEAGRTWAVRRSNSTVFEVFADYSVMVDLEQRTCSCRLWQIDGFPCTHAVAAILAKRDSVYDYVECYYKTDFFRKAYESPIFPIPDIGKGLGSNGSAAVVVLPPITKRPAGRPPTKRIKGPVPNWLFEALHRHCSEIGHSLGALLSDHSLALACV